MNIDSLVNKKPPVKPLLSNKKIYDDYCSTNNIIDKNGKLLLQNHKIIIKTKLSNGVIICYHRDYSYTNFNDLCVHLSYEYLNIKKNYVYVTVEDVVLKHIGLIYGIYE